MIIWTVIKAVPVLWSFNSKTNFLISLFRSITTMPMWGKWMSLPSLGASVSFLSMCHPLLSSSQECWQCLKMLAAARNSLLAQASSPSMKTPQVCRDVGQDGWLFIFFVIKQYSIRSWYNVSNFRPKSNILRLYLPMWINLYYCIWVNI